MPKGDNREIEVGRSNIHAGTNLAAVSKHMRIDKRQCAWLSRAARGEFNQDWLNATGASGGKPCTVPVSYTRWLERYCGAGATGATCDLSTNPKAVEDTITSVLPANFAIRDFKLFECGSALPVCSGDIVAGPPVQALCKNLDASPTHTCSFSSLPKDGHLTCHATQYESCRTWFEGLLPP
jgi:hypothetical protein